jgi:hypothetical protein
MGIRITDLEYVGFLDITNQDLLVVHNYQTPEGITKKTTIQDLKDVIGSMSGGTNVFVTGGTYSNGTATFTNTTGGTFNVTGFYTGGTDLYITGVTYNNNTFTFTNNTGGTFNTTFNVVTGLTVNGNLNVTGNTSLQSLTATTISGGTYFNLPAGRLGIANSSGVYTFYNSWTSAMAAAVAGQTIEMFADFTESTNVSVNLKNGVNINGNGHTFYYTNSLGVPFQDNGVAVTCSILNLNISRTSSLSSGSNILLTGNSRIDFTGSYIYRNVVTDNYACIEIQGGARINNAYCVSEWGRGIWSTNSSSLIENSYGQNLQGGGQGIISSGNVFKCTGIGTSLMGIDITSSTGLAINSIGISITSVGIRGNTVNCTGISTSGNGIGAQTVTSHRNSTGISSSGGAFSTGGSSSTNYNCTYETNSGTFGASSEGGQYFNCSISVLSGTANAIVAPSRVLNCVVRVSSTSAFCLYSVIARTVNYNNNSFLGTTIPIATTITQGTTNVQDNQGNILM